MWTFTFDWLVTADQAAKSFLAHTSGTFDTSSGNVILGGLVCSGWHAGARVHEEGKLVDPATLSFAGDIHILPGSSADATASTVVCP